MINEVISIKKKLDNLPTNSLIKENKLYNNHLKLISKLLTNYDKNYKLFIDAYNNYKRKLKKTIDYSSENMEIISKEKGNFFSKRAFYSLKLKKNSSIEKYSSLLNDVIISLEAVKKSNIFFHKRLYLPCSKNDCMINFGEITNNYIHTPSIMNLFSDERFKAQNDPIDNPSYWLLNSTFLYSMDRFATNKDDDKNLFYFQESMEKIQKKIKHFHINNIPKKEIYKREIEFFEKKIRKIELILRSRKKSKFKDDNKGYVYILSNKSLPENTFKIGSTYNTPEERAEELTGTGHLDPFKVSYKMKILRAEYYEKIIHRLLIKNRVKKNREFFKLELKKIIKIFKDLYLLSNKGEKKVDFSTVKRKII